MKTGKPTITAHCLVKNEENFIWYAVNAVLPYVDKMIIFDTGSNDRTVEIIREILKTPEGKRKIRFEEKGEVDKQGHTNLRNEMVKMTDTDWFMVLDGDEIWPGSQIRYLLEEDLKNAQLLEKKCILVNFHLCSLDLSHFTERGHYYFDWGLHGQMMPRLYATKLGVVEWRGIYGVDQVYFNGVLVLKQPNVFISSTYFWHLSKLKRSSKDSAVFSRAKPSVLNLLPRYLRKYFVLKSPQKIEISNKKG